MYSHADPVRLPPLILHPFSAADDAALLMESSRASLTLSGYYPRTDATPEELDAKLLRGRYAELKMLFYIGKDVTRWMDQCTETVATMAYTGRRIQPETFALYLVQNIPDSVRLKLEGWGVADYNALFRRSIGFHTVFAAMPAANQLSDEFLRKYHRHLDAWWEFRMRDVLYDRAEEGEFAFDLYASGEYTMMLERSWADSSSAAQ